MFVYKITNKVNDKIYVGQTTQVLDQRIEQHTRATTPLGKDIKKYGVTNFKIEILAVCSSINELKKIEKEWIKKLNCKVPNGYNQSDGGETPIPHVSLVKKQPKLTKSDYMNVDLEERTIAEQLKFLATYRGYTIKTFGEEFNKRRETQYSPPSFSRKLNNGNFNFEELKTISEILGFKVKLELIE